MKKEEVRKIVEKLEKWCDEIMKEWSTEESPVKSAKLTADANRIRRCISQLKQTKEYNEVEEKEEEKKHEQTN